MNPNLREKFIQECIKQMRQVAAREGDAMDKEQISNLNNEIDSVMDIESNESFETESHEEEFVEQEIGQQVQNRLNQGSSLRQLCSAITIDKDNVDIPKSINSINAKWSLGKTAATATDNFDFNVVRTFELNAQPKITQKMLQDSAINVEEWLTSQLVSMFGAKEDEAFLFGDGDSSPEGILNGEEVSRIDSTEDSNGDFNENDLLNLFYALPTHQARNAKFLMNKATVHKIRTMKDPYTGQYYWNPGLMLNPQDTLMGVPLFTNDSMKVAKSDEAGELILYGDFSKAYTIVDRKHITIQKDPYSSKPFVIYYTSKQVGGTLTDPTALVSLKA